MHRLGERQPPQHLNRSVSGLPEFEQCRVKRMSPAGCGPADEPQPESDEGQCEETASSHDRPSFDASCATSWSPLWMRMSYKVRRCRSPLVNRSSARSCRMSWATCCHTMS